MVALLNGAQGMLEWGACAVDDEEEFVLPGLANDRLRLQSADIDACRGEDAQLDGWIDFDGHCTACAYFYDSSRNCSCR